MRATTSLLPPQPLPLRHCFRPARTRIQGFIDRRFYGSQYDAVHAVTNFSAKLRDQTDLSKLNADLRAVVSKTMQLTHVSLWLKMPQK